MRTVVFDEDEYIVMAMFAAEKRQETIQNIEEILPFIQDDTELMEIVTGTVEKMKRMPDDQFYKLDLEPYRQEAEDD